MRTYAGTGLHASLRSFPGAVLELAPDATVLDSNGRLERKLEREVVGLSFTRVLDPDSRAKWDRLLALGGEAEAQVWELVLEGREFLATLSFALSRTEEDGRERLWLVEYPRDPRLEQLHEELSATNSELVNTKRELSKEKARLVRALEELERELRENEHLSQQLQQQNEEVEAQNEELMAMTEEMHASQDQLLMLNQQLERRTRELQVALSARNRFYAAMSHELRTPINAVMGYNDLLLTGVYGALGEKQELAVERSQSAARHLRALVDDVLDLSRIEIGRAELETETVDMQRLLEELVSLLRPLADGRGSPLSLVVRDTPCTVVTDARRVRQVVLNLLSNAIKFGKGNPIWVYCGRSRDGGVEVEVVDGGEGISEEDLARIFDEFVQLGADAIGTSSAGGTGLGLPIARRLAEFLGGRLDVSSTPGVGSTFRLSLPQVAPGSA